MTEHKEVCLSINGAQSVRLEKGTIEFKSYFTQIPVTFKFYVDFECNEKVLRDMKVLTEKSIKIIFLVVLLPSVFVLMINLVNLLMFLEAKMRLKNFLKQFLKSISIVKK